MKFDAREPCASCPYRTDARRKRWHRAEFERLLQWESDPLGAIYGCHEYNRRPDDAQVCVGWLLDQRRRRLPSNMLRLEVSRNKEASRCLDEATSPVPLYPTLEDMCKQNGVSARSPRPEHEVLRDLCRLAIKLGGRVRFVDHNTWEELSSGELFRSPFGCTALRWKEKEVIVPQGEKPSPGDIIHELGHVFASQKPPLGCDELEFLGWEYAVARRTRCFRRWLDDSRDYEIGDGSSLGSLTLKERRELFRDRVRYAEKQRMIGPNLEPLSVRG